MIEYLPAFLQGLVTSAKAMASFDAFRKGRKGDVRVLNEEMKENSRLCFRVVSDDVYMGVVVPKFMTIEFDRLNKAGFNFNVLKGAKIPGYSGMAKTDLASWQGKSTAELVQNIYDKIKTIKSAVEYTPNHPTARRRIINIHKRVLLFLRHAEA